MSFNISLSTFRSKFPALDKKIEGKRLVYLDSACTALKSTPVINAVSRFYTDLGVCGGKRSTHLLSQRVEGLLANARSAAAQFIHASSANEIVFTSGTTESMNLLARAFPFDHKKNEVVITELEHNAVFLPFYELAREGKLALKICRAPAGNLDLNHLQDLVTERTTLVVMTHASNVYGGVLPVNQAARIAHGKGALIALDDAQFAASHEENVQDNNVDFASFSLHKLGGPFGVGVLYGKEHLLNGLGLFKTGGGTLKTLENTPENTGFSVRYLDAPQRFEAGVGNYAGIAGAPACLELLQSVGAENMRRHIRGLLVPFLKRLEQTNGIRMLGNKNNLFDSSLVSFVFENPGLAAADFSLFLSHELPGHTVAVRTGEHCAHLLHARHGLKESVRVSLFGYSEKKDLDIFCQALAEFLHSARRGKSKSPAALAS